MFTFKRQLNAEFRKINYSRSQGTRLDWVGGGILAYFAQCSRAVSSKVALMSLSHVA